jgi:hypothetical protein
MTTQELDHYTGISSFFEFYKWLIMIKKDAAEYVTIDKDGVKVPISIQLIKAQALAEVCARLPSKATVQLMHEMVDGGPHTAQHMHTFLDNLLTRD